MADKTELLQAIDDAILDADSLEQFINGSDSETVLTRLSAEYPTLQKAIKELFENGGLPATPFKTKVEMQSSSLDNGSYAVVTDEGIDSGLYLKESGAWIKSSYDPVGISKDYSDELYGNIGLYVTENILDLSQETAQGYLSGGNPTNDPTSIHTTFLEYYPVRAGSYIWVRDLPPVLWVALYDKNKVYIPSSAMRESSFEENVLQIPSVINGKTPYYIRLSTSRNPNLLSLGVGSIAPDRLLEYGEIYSKFINDNTPNALVKYIDSGDNPITGVIQDTSREQVGRYVKVYENLINPNQDLHSGYYSNSGFVDRSDGIYYAGTEFIEIPKSRKFWVYGVAGGNVVQVADAQKNPVGIVFASTIPTNILEIPEIVNGKDAVYVRFATNKGLQFYQDGGVAAGYSDEYDSKPTEAVPYGSPKTTLSDDLLETLADDLDSAQSSLRGKRLLVVGDSITATSNSYANVLTARHDAVLIKHAESGARVHREEVEQTWRVLSETFTAIPDDTNPDVILIAAGTNDLNGSVKNIGDFSDRVTTTFYGALHILIKGLRVKFKDARIGYISPIAKASARTYPQDESNINYIKTKAIKEVCSYYSIPVWDGMANLGFHPADDEQIKSKLMPDGLHPSAEGHEWYANRIEGFILNLAK